MIAYYGKFVCRLDPWPPSLMETFGRLNMDVYHQDHPSRTLFDQNVESAPIIDDLDFELWGGLVKITA